MGLDIGAFALRWFQDYYGIPYPADKVDLLALPDFAAGAMENLGCITFRETLLLVDPATSTQAEQQNVADVVAHELAHMWFGDLVTMRWWNGIWLNEAFATFMELAACDAYRPDWGRWTLFGLERSAAFETDSLASTRSVEYEVRSPEDCEGMFDVLTYQKGGALLRMLEQYLGEDRFREGVSHYLRTHEYGNTETNDLWDAIEATSGDPVRRDDGLLDLAAGLPAGHRLARRRRARAAPAAVRLRRRRRWIEAAATWLVPVMVRTDVEQATTLLDETDGRIRLDDVSAPDRGQRRRPWVLPGRLRRRSARPASTGPALAKLDTLERYNLVDDAWNEVVAGRLTAADYLGFVQGFGAERELAVWQAILVGLRGAGRLLDDAALPPSGPRVQSLLAPVVADLGEPAEGEDDLRAKFRGLAHGRAGRARR